MLSSSAACLSFISSPCGDGYHHCFHVFFHSSLFHLIPMRGRIPERFTNEWRTIPFHLILMRGRIPCDGYGALGCDHCFISSPCGDGYSYKSPKAPKSFIFHLIPMRGRILFAISKKALGQNSFISSPCGDGCSSGSLSFTLIHLFHLIPMRGRIKHCYMDTKTKKAACLI